MTTNPEDTETRGTSPEGGRTPVLEDPAPPDDDREAAEADLSEGADSTEEELETARPAPWGKGFLAETFAATGLLMIVGLLAGVRVLEVLPSLFAQSQEGVISGILLAEGVTALLAVLFSVGGLALANAATSTWVRWVAPATIIVGLILAAASGGAYLQVPEPQPQMTVPGG